MFIYHPESTVKHYRWNLWRPWILHLTFEYTGNIHIWVTAYSLFHLNVIDFYFINVLFIRILFYMLMALHFLQSSFERIWCSCYHYISKRKQFLFLYSIYAVPLRCQPQFENVNQQQSHHFATFPTVPVACGKNIFLFSFPLYFHL